MVTVAQIDVKIHLKHVRSMYSRRAVSEGTLADA